MASGGPGDHWLTDLFQWELPAFGEPIDGLLREVVRFGGHKEVEGDRPLARTLDRLWWPPNRKDGELDQVQHALIQLRNRLKDDATRGGWEIS